MFNINIADVLFRWVEFNYYFYSNLTCRVNIPTTEFLDFFSTCSKMFALETTLKS